MYQHSFLNGEVFDFSPGKAVCVGRNYLGHIKELNNDIPEEPLLFIKSKHCFVSMHEPLELPDYGECHNELEVALLIGEHLTKDNATEPLNALAGVGLALDLTLRDVQQRLKEKGHPWERAKSFNGSCPVSRFVPLSQITDLQKLNFTLSVNGETRQSGNTQNMIFSCGELLREIVSVFSLVPGDVVLTGTPKGVGPLYAGDRLLATLENLMIVNTTVAVK